MEDERKGMPLLYIFIGMMIMATLIGGYFIITMLTADEETDTTTAQEAMLSEEYLDVAWYGDEEIGDYINNAILLKSDGTYEFVVSSQQIDRYFIYEEGSYLPLDLSRVALFPNNRSFSDPIGEDLGYYGWVLSLGEISNGTVTMSGVFLNGGTDEVTMYQYQDNATNLDEFSSEVTSTE